MKVEYLTQFKKKNIREVKIDLKQIEINVVICTKNNYQYISAY